MKRRTFAKLLAWLPGLAFLAPKALAERSTGKIPGFDGFDELDFEALGLKEGYDPVIIDCNNIDLGLPKHRRAKVTVLTSTTGTVVYEVSRDGEHWTEVSDPDPVMFETAALPGTVLHTPSPEMEPFDFFTPLSSKLS